MTRIIYKEKIPSTDKKLGRNIEHDSKSLEFGFDTRGLSIINIRHKRNIPVLNQAEVSSCTGNAGVGDIATTPLFETLPNVKKYSLDEPGAVKLYSDAEIIDGGIGYPPEDIGSSGLSVAKALYNASLISSYQHTFTLQDALKAGSLYPFITGINWYSNMFNPDADGRVHPTGNIAGGHEIVCDEIDADNGRIWFTNSWLNNDGTLWGVNGRFYLTWLDYSFLLSQRGDVTILLPLTVNPVPVPIQATVRIGDRGELVKILQLKLNANGATLTTDGVFGVKTQVAVKAFQSAHNLVVDGICGKATWRAFDMIEVITLICTQNALEPILGVSVACCESGLNPKATFYNPKSNSVDRGLFMWNTVFHKEVTDTMAFDPATTTKLFCDAVKAGNLHNFWIASQKCWIAKLPPEIILKYHL